MFTHSRNGITNHGENDRLTVKGLEQEAYQFNSKRKESTGSSGNKAVDSASESNSVAWHYSSFWDKPTDQQHSWGNLSGSLVLKEKGNKCKRVTGSSKDSEKHWRMYEVNVGEDQEKKMKREHLQDLSGIFFLLSNH